MEGLEFIAVIIVLAAILAWYLQNITTGGDGSRGLLAMRTDPKEVENERPKRSYRSKSRIAGRAQDRPAVFAQKAGGQGAASDAVHAERMRRKFRRQDEARYRVKDRRPKDPDAS